MTSATAKRRNGKIESPVPQGYRAPIAILIAVACFLSLAYLVAYSPHTGTALKVLFSFLSLGISGLLMAYVLGVPGFYGFFILKTERGLKFIDMLAVKYRKPWDAIVDWGFVLSFGLLTPFFFKKYVSKKMLVFGIASIILMELFVLPYLTVAYGLVNIQQLSAGTSAYSQVGSGGSIDYLGIFFTAISIVGGFALFILSELAFIAAIILHGIIAFVFATATSPTGTAPAVSTLPGPAGVPVIAVAIFKPEIIIPLILSLALLVTLHEFSHGVIARQNKIKLKSIGTFLFGIIPLGAFVEPVEKDISKLPLKQQDRISIAGVAFNLMLTIFFFLLMLVMLYLVLPHFSASAVYIAGTVTGSPSQNVIALGSVIYSWNGHQVSNISALEVAAAGDKPYSTVTLQTSNGTYAVQANATGKIGVFLQEEELPIGGNNVTSTVVNFIYEFIGLSFLLNFYVAIFNILPIPMFDGWRIYKLKLGKKLLMIVTAIAVIVLVLLFVPWIWSL